MTDTKITTVTFLECLSRIVSGRMIWTDNTKPLARASGLLQTA